MAYQTRNRSTRPSTGAQPQIVYLQQQNNQNNTTPAQTTTQHVTSYISTNVNTFTDLQQSTQESTTIAATTESDAGYEDLLEDPKGEEEDSNRPKWMKKRKDPTFKVSKKVRRKRMNAKLRRLLQPKNAIMVLNELKESVKFTFHEQTNAMQQNYFVVTVEVDGQMYTGQGLSKPAAKQNAAENALKALLLEKMAQNAQASEAGDGDVPMKEEPDASMGAQDVPPGEEPPLLDEEGKPMSRQQQQPEDDVPWGSLASFALFKLFNDWQSQGTQLPLARSGSNSGGGGGGNNAGAATAATAAAPSGGSDGGFSCENRGPAPMKKLPDNPTERHPVMLLNQLRPSLVFNDVSMQGVAPNVVFTVAVTIDGVAYQGMGKNKKEGKKEAAKAALAAVFNIHYDN